MTDIVERLRARKCSHDIAEQESAVCWDGLCPLCLDAEIERLRAALESLTKDPPSTLDEPDTDAEVIIKMRAIASDALSTPGSK